MIIMPERLANGSEDGEQAALFCWAAQSGYACLKWMYAIPNGGSRHIAEATKLVATGVKSGVADIHLPVPIKDTKTHPWIQPVIYTSLYIEMKKANGVPSDWKPKQKDFCAFVEMYNNAYFVAYGWKEAVTIIESYLNEKPLFRCADGRLRQSDAQF